VVQFTRDEERVSTTAISRPADLGADGAPLDLHVVAIPDELYRRLHALSVNGDRSVADEINKAIRDHLERGAAGAPKLLNENRRSV
jgi:post-segregation antitoxin (ccd killing protein)